MKYVHPDVLDNGPAHIRANARRALLLPNYTIGMTYAQAVAAALISAPVTSVDFTMSNEGTGRKLVFAGASAAATKNINAGAPLHIALTDGASRILLVDEEKSGAAIVIGMAYKIPVITYVCQQPQS